MPEEGIDTVERSAGKVLGRGSLGALKKKGQLFTDTFLVVTRPCFKTWLDKTPGEDLGTLLLQCVHKPFPTVAFSKGLSTAQVAGP